MRFAIICLAVAIYMLGCTSPPPGPSNYTAISGLTSKPAHSNYAAISKEKFKNIIVIVADGCGIAHETITRWAKFPAPMAIDKCKVALVRTYCANSLITDSAPAATAFACGIKAFDKTIGIMPEKITIPGIDTVGSKAAAFRPVANCLELARHSGMATGIVATSQIQHTTPAGFSAHTQFRDHYTEIALQQVHQNIDVMLGGGEKYLVDSTLTLFSDTSTRGVRHDGLDLRKTLAQRNYRTLFSRKELASLPVKPGMRVCGLFAPQDLAYEADRRYFYSDRQPSLAEMTSKAIALLNANGKKGFFLFIEASKVDWASHANDASGVVSDYWAFNQALDSALAFAKKNGSTLVVAFSDHDNGGMALQKDYAGYSSFPYDEFIKPFNTDTLLTGEGIELLFRKNPSLRDSAGIRKVFATYYGISDLTNEEFEKVYQPITSDTRDLNKIIGSFMSKRAGIGWSTTGHDGSDVLLFSFGLSQLPEWIDNTDIARLCARNMNPSLGTMTSKLFAPIDSLFPGAKVVVDSVADTITKKMRYSTCTIVLSKGKAILPINTDSLTTSSGKQFCLGGISIWAPKLGRLFVPATAKSILRDIE
jgi:alkaline phosphatase